MSTVDMEGISVAGAAVVGEAQARSTRTSLSITSSSNQSQGEWACCKHVR